MLLSGHLTVWRLRAATTSTGKLKKVKTPIPGLGGNLRLDLTTLLSTVAGAGNTSLPIAISANPALAGFEFFAQGVTFNGVAFDFQNITGMKVW